jgi:phosphoserine phosphatase
MDSTLINIECVDEIAAFAGCGAQVAAITEAAMRGEIADYKESLRRRVALLAGQPESTLERVYQERLQLNPGVETFVAACQAAGLKTLLISGGFTFFSERIRQRLRLDFARANSLGVADGRLTGTLLQRPWATSSTARRRSACCWRCASSWASPPRRPSRWATAPTTCP